MAVKPEQVWTYIGQAPDPELLGGALSLFAATAHVQLRLLQLFYICETVQAVCTHIHTHEQTHTP